MNVAEVAPAGTVTEAGKVATVLLEESVTEVPPVGAGPLSVTVPTEDPPPRTVDGTKATADAVAALTVRVAVLLTVPVLAVIVSVAVVATAVVVTVNVAVVDPAATTTEDGTDADVALEERVTVVPPVGAAPVRVTVPVEEVPPVTDVGLTATLDAVGASTVSFAVLVDAPEVPVIVTTVFAATGVVVMV